MKPGDTGLGNEGAEGIVNGGIEPGDEYNPQSHTSVSIPILQTAENMNRDKRCQEAGKGTGCKSQEAHPDFCGIAQGKKLGNQFHHRGEHNGHHGRNRNETGAALTFV